MYTIKSQDLHQGQTIIERTSTGVEHLFTIESLHTTKCGVWVRCNTDTNSKFFEYDERVNVL